ncbi:MAG: hypothetical protein ABI778_01395 [Ignavibacteriota bacterium]
MKIVLHLQNIHRNSSKYYAALAAYIAVIFFANTNHINQQGIFFNEYLPIAKHLLSGAGYVIHSGVSILYPIWGYTFLTAVGEFVGAPILFLAILQGVLCIIGISFFYKIFQIEKKYWHILLFTPFIALTSVRWPDAIVGVLLLLTIYYYTQSFKLSFGLILNFRSEYVGLLVVLIITILILLLRKKFDLAVLTTLTLIPACLLIIPWGSFSYSMDSHIRLTATNGGGVLYISLGQLPNNPWGIVHSDSVAYAVAKENGIDDPYSVRGDSLLSAKFITDIENYPINFSEKAGFNILTSFVRGVYIGEYQSVAQTIIKIIFVVIFDILVLLFLLYIKRKRNMSSLLLILIVIVLYKFLLISLIQYEPRHMNAIYLLILGPALLFLKDRFEAAEPPSI